MGNIDNPEAAMNGRVPDDFYPTPRWCVDLLWQWLVSHARSRRHVHVLDPCAGSGAILAALPDSVETFSARRIPVSKYAVELRARDHEALHRLTDGRVVFQDALEPIAWPWPLWPLDNPQFDLVIQNPPFEHAEEFVRTWTPRHYGGLTATLVRLNWYASAARHELFRDLPPSKILVMPNRPAFVATCAPRCRRWPWRYLGSTCPDCDKRVKASTDSTEYCWMIHRPQEQTGITTIHRLGLVSAADRRIVWDPERFEFVDRKTYQAGMTNSHSSRRGHTK